MGASEGLYGIECIGCKLKLRLQLRPIKVFINARGTRLVGGGDDRDGSSSLNKSHDDPWRRRTVPCDVHELKCGSLSERDAPHAGGA